MSLSSFGDSVLLVRPDRSTTDANSSLSQQVDPSQTRKGLSMWLTSVFIAGEMAGSGVLALPRALADSGWSGVAVLLICCLNALYAGICLGRCWVILEERWAEYRGKFRYPYPAIASRAVAPWMRYVVSFCVDFTLFGVATVFLLLSSQMIGSIAAKWGISFCYWILILAAILCPLMWKGTPDDFWPAAVIALVTTSLAAILLVVAIGLDTHNTSPAPTPSVSSFFLAFAKILFAFGGASTFPTFQNDMKDRSQFPKSASIGFAVLVVLYVPVAIAGYMVYAGDVKVNIIQSLTNSSGPLTITIEVLLAIHLFFAFLLAINAPAQEFEELLRIPNRFGWKRCALRTAIMLLIVFVAVSIPRFGKILDLVGGSTVTLMTFIFPPLFYMLLSRQRSPEWPERSIPLYEKIYLIEIMIIGVIGGCISTYSAIKSIIVEEAFNPPCYVNITAAGML